MTFCQLATYFDLSCRWCHRFVAKLNFFLRLQLCLVSAQGTQQITFLSAQGTQRIICAFLTTSFIHSRFAVCPQRTLISSTLQKCSFNAKPPPPHLPDKAPNQSKTCFIIGDVPPHGALAAGRHDGSDARAGRCKTRREETGQLRAQSDVELLFDNKNTAEDPLDPHFQTAPQRTFAIFLPTNL